MNQPNPWILVMGGIALLNVSMVVGGLKAPAWARYGGMGLCVMMGIAAIVLGLQRYFQKKPERPKFVPKRKRQESSHKP
ncbi:Hypothetical protein A7982_02321 [Minicystis rosea]|nr:Hypothetical protein A7982_02321 [Minicystis rosea]